MILFIASFILIVLLTPSLSAQGLFFTGNEKTIAERSSLSLPPSSRKAGAVSEYGFEVNVRNHNLGSPGYIFYLENTEGEEAYTLNVTFDKYTDKVTFTLAKNGERNLFSADFTSTEVREKSLPVSFRINYDTGELYFSISDRHTSVNLPEIKGGKFAPQLFFGMTRNMVECACFSIRNLNILSDGELVIIPLNESSGEIVHDADGRDAGHVSNPMWLICKAYNWEKVISIYSATPAGVTFDPLRHTIYSYDTDSLHCYNTLDRKLDSRELRGDSLPVLHGMCSFDTGSNRIIPYEIYNLANVWEINPESAEHRWLSEQALHTVWHHHAQAFQREKRGILLFGGFGNRSYSNALVRYDLTTLRWDTIQLTGDRIDPRFFSSMMLTPSEDTLYIYGGKGNREGRQEAGIKYYYDLYEVDLRNNKVKKLWEQTTPDFDRVPTRHLIPSADGRYFYTMAYAEYRPHSSLQLYRVDMATGEQTAVGDSIPLISEEILTNVALYDDPDLERIYCVVQEYQKYGQNLTTVYSICTPPVSASELMAADNRSLPLIRRWWIWIIISILLLLTLLLIRKRRLRHDVVETPDVTIGTHDVTIGTHVTVGTRRGASTASSASSASSVSSASSESAAHTESSVDEIKEDEEKEFILRDETNRIELFGPFRVSDNKGHDITYMFSPKLKKSISLHTAQYSCR